MNAYMILPQTHYTATKCILFSSCPLHSKVLVPFITFSIKVIYLMSRVWHQLTEEEKNRDMSSLTKEEKNRFMEIGRHILASGDHKYS